MEKIQHILESMGLDKIPPDVLSGIGLLLVVFILWRLAVIKVKALVGIAVVIALGLAAWHGYLWMHS